jgi:putative Mn2+ efflux pump MntP
MKSGESSPSPADTRTGGFGMHVNWSLVRIVLFIWVLIDSFNLGRSSIEFNGTGTAWSMLILGVVTLVCALLGLAVADLLRVKPNQS